MVLFFTSVSGAAEQFTLQRSIKYGIQHSPILQSEAIKIHQTEMDIKAQRGRFLPSISTGYSRNRIFSQYASGSVDEDYIDQRNSVASLKISQELFAGFENLNRFERAKLTRSYQESQFEMQKIDLVYKIKAVFFELLKTRYDITSISQKILRVESDLASARAFSDKKIAPYFYVLQAEADLEEAKQQLLKTQNFIFQYTERLKRILGLPLNPAISVAIEFDDNFEIPLNDVNMETNQYIEKALEKRPEITLMALKADMAEKDAAIAKSRYYPRINLDMGLYDSDKDYDKNTQNDQHNTYWSAGVSVQMNLFDGGTAHYNIERYLLEIQRIKKEKDQIEMEIKEEVSVAIHSLSEAQKRLLSVENSLIASHENYTRQKKRFDARIGTTSQVLDAQAMLARAEAGKGQAILDYQMAMAELHRAIGLSDLPGVTPGPAPELNGHIKPDLEQ